MQAIILAGGFGTRLRAVVGDVPKPLAPIHQQPFLAYLLTYLHTQGVTDVVLSVHYLAEKIMDYFQAHFAGINIRYAHESEPLGTGGAIRHALQYIDPSRPVLVVNGDTLVKGNYRDLAARHHGLLTMVLRTVADRSRYGAVDVCADKVTTFYTRGPASAGHISAGVYMLDPNLFAQFSLPQVFSFETDFLLPYCPQIQPQAFFVDDYFIDIGVPEDYARACREFS